MRHFCINQQAGVCIYVWEQLIEGLWINAAAEAMIRKNSESASESD